MLQPHPTTSLGADLLFVKHSFAFAMSNMIAWAKVQLPGAVAIPKLTVQSKLYSS